MTTEQKAAKLAEIDAHIEALAAELKTIRNNPVGKADRERELAYFERMKTLVANY